MVREPTRDKYLLDLVLTDIEGAKCKVLPKLADHACVLVQCRLPIPQAEVKQCWVWRYDKADWDSLRDTLKNIDWDSLCDGSADLAAERLTNYRLEAVKFFIPKTMMRERKATHPWVNRRVVELVRRKHLAAGSPNAKSADEACSAALRENVWKYIEKERQRLQKKNEAAKAGGRWQDDYLGRLTRLQHSSS